jgi:hypothetical protein
MANVGRGCGSGIVPTAIQQPALARLAYVGITVSNTHNARLSVDLNCVAAASIQHSKTIAVDECLTFSELISTPSNDARPMFTSTWRKCRSFTCDRKCAATSERYGAQLMGEFLNELWDRSPTDSLPLGQNRPLQDLRAAVPQGISPQPATATVTSNPPQDTSPPGTTARSAVFGGYILTCISVLVYWQFRNRGSWY